MNQLTIVAFRISGAADGFACLMIRPIAGLLNMARFLPEKEFRGALVLWSIGLCKCLLLGNEKYGKKALEPTSGNAK